jgi:hypothetical protein
MPSYLGIGDLVPHFPLRQHKGESVDFVSPYDDSNGDDDSNANNFLSTMAWRIRFLDTDIEVGMMPSLCNKFLRSLLHSFMVRSDHNKGLARVNISLKSI